jgi:hypothetical protein
MSNSQNRPIAIRIAAILQIITGSVGLLLSCRVILNIFNIVFQAGDSSNNSLTSIAGGFGEVLPLLLLSIGQVVMGLGMLYVRQWSWLGSLVLQVICLLDSLLPLIWGEISNPVSVIVAATVLYLLLQQDVRTFFRRGPT